MTSKTITNLLNTRLWIAHIDDERAEGNSIIVTLDDDYEFLDDPGCGVKGFDTMREVQQGTRLSEVINRKNRIGA
jgi:hypothetical protein